MRGFPGFGARVEEALRNNGWINKAGDPDVMGFSKKHGYSSQDLYRWKQGRLPETPTLERLAEQLQVSIAWLLLGHECPTPSASAGTQPQGKSNVVTRSRVRRQARGLKTNKNNGLDGTLCQILARCRNRYRKPLSRAQQKSALKAEYFWGSETFQEAS